MDWWIDGLVGDVSQPCSLCCVLSFFSFWVFSSSLVFSQVNDHHRRAEIAQARQHIRIVGVARDKHDAAWRTPCAPLQREVHQIDDDLFVQRLFRVALRAIDEREAGEVQLHPIGVGLMGRPRVKV